MRRQAPFITAALCAFVLPLAGCAQSLFFYPDQVERPSPSEFGLAYVESDFSSADGTALTGWFIPAIGAPHAHGTVIQLHGNAENMSSHWRLVEWLPARGFNVFVFDYRGYGRSAGRPTPEGLADDSVAAVRHVASLPGVDPSRIFLLGQSLGGTNAIVAAARPDCPPVAAIAIESTFRSYSSVANDKLFLAGSMMDDALSAERYVDELPPVPILFFHGTEDRVVSTYHSESLYALAREPKRLVLVAGCGHLEVFQEPFAAENRSILEAFFLAAVKGDAASSAR
jgi:fermentation-respiration switch protein FrsA (DUF1100 family)